MDLRPLRSVLRQLPDRGRPRRVHGGRTPVRHRELRPDRPRPDPVHAGKTAAALWSSLGVESVGQRRCRKDCTDDSPAEPLYRRRWLIQALSIWGFLGLLVATGLDWGLALIGVKATGTPVPL